MPRSRRYYDDLSTLTGPALSRPSLFFFETRPVLRYRRFRRGRTPVLCQNRQKPGGDTLRILPEAHFPELPNYYRGKVRENYDLPDGRRIIISTDRLSAFDRILACIPYKGQVLTQTARYWFDATADICPNHVLDYPDPNVVIGKRLTILPVEIVVRGYLAGTTGTSILTLYKKGQRTMYGVTLPDGMRDNQILPQPIITPTSKAFDGGHDEPLTPAEIVAQGLLTEEQWNTLSSYALALFARGQELAARRGLILVDTKYEFGTDAQGTIILADEIHTPDSSRYWIADSYRESFEKANGRRASTRTSSEPGWRNAATPIMTKYRRSRGTSSRKPRASTSGLTKRLQARPSFRTTVAKHRLTGCAATCLLSSREADLF